MKKILSILSLLLALASCGNLYTGNELMSPSDDPDAPGTDGSQGGGGGSVAVDNKIPVMVAFSDPIYNVLTNDTPPQTEPAPDDNTGNDNTGTGDNTGNDNADTPPTRGVGVIDPEQEDTDAYHERMSNVNFFVYAFRRDRPGGMHYNYNGANDPDNHFCLLDGSRDTLTADQLENLQLTQDQAWKHGKWARYNGNGSFVNWRSLNDIPYYSIMQQLDPFRFFAYCYDDAKILGDGVRREPDHNAFDVEIDGSQDLMCASSVDLSKVVDAIEAGNEVEPALQILAKRMAELKPDELKTVKSYHYSTYSARFNLWPVIRMKHQLAYVKLNFYPAIKNPSDTLYIQSVKFLMPTEGTFTVAAENPAQVGLDIPVPDSEEEMSWLPIWGHNGDPRSWYDPDATPEENTGSQIQVSEEEQSKHDPYERTPLMAGMMLAPAGNYVQIKIETIYYPNGDKSQYKIDEHLHLLNTKQIVNKDKDGAFLGYGLMKGRTYTIKAAVHGPQEIQIEVVQDGWAHGGNVDVYPNDWLE